MTTGIVSRIGSAPEEGIKAPVIAATNVNITLSGLQTIGGVSVVTGDRVLVKDQTNAAQNGIWLAFTEAWERAPDFNRSDDVVNGVLIVNAATSTLYKIIITSRWVPNTTPSTYVEVGLLVPAAISTEYCPGYTYVYSTTTLWKVAGFNVTNVFSVGKRLKFNTAGTIVYGTVSNSTFSTDTSVTMVMEDSAVLPNATTEVCQVTGTAGWSPIASDPFGGTAINDICTGAIDGVQWWIAVGDGGKFATSNDGGASWTLLSTTTTENLNCCTYNSDDETFWSGGDAGILVNTSNGTSVTEDSTTIAAFATTGPGDIWGIEYCNEIGSKGLVVLYLHLSTTWYTAYTINQGSSWTSVVNGVMNVSGKKSLKCGRSSATVRESTWRTITSTLGAQRLTTLTDTGWSGEDTSELTNSSMGYFYDGAANSRVYGNTDGHIEGMVTWTGDDTTTFTTQRNGFAYSPSLAVGGRLVTVGHSASIGYLDGDDKAVNNAWTIVQNGAALGSNLNAVARNETDGMFVAVGSTGQILRSINGLV
tara:strand:+ start:3825 stop:5423 length:1599 start_codon:yes stop_codon:yes gene_type:complete